MQAEPTLQNVMESIQVLNGSMVDLKTSMEGRMEKMDGGMEKMDGRMGNIEGSIQEVVESVVEFSTHVDVRFDRLEGRVTTIETTMVTKNYLDEKIFQLRGDLVALARKGNTKLSVLVDELVTAGRLAPDVAARILALEPFQQYANQPS